MKGTPATREDIISQLEKYTERSSLGENIVSMPFAGLAEQLRNEWNIPESNLPDMPNPPPPPPEVPIGPGDVVTIGGYVEEWWLLVAIDGDTAFLRGFGSANTSDLARVGGPCEIKPGDAVLLLRDSLPGVVMETFRDESCLVVTVDNAGCNSGDWAQASRHELRRLTVPEPKP